MIFVKIYLNFYLQETIHWIHLFFFFMEKIKYISFQLQIIFLMLKRINILFFNFRLEIIFKKNRKKYYHISRSFFHEIINSLFNII